MIGRAYVIESCTFFGHRQCYVSIEIISTVIEKLIAEGGVSKFFVGNNGDFDVKVTQALKALKQKYSFIEYFIVLAYLPVKNISMSIAGENLIIPDGIENIHRRYAISYRNRWMIDHSDIVVAYITKSFGGAFQFVELSKKKGKTVYNIAEL